MAIKKGNKYACSYCGKLYADDIQANSCRDNHDLIYLQLSRNDLNNLHNYLYIHEEKLLTESLMNAIKRAVRTNALTK